MEIEKHIKKTKLQKLKELGLLGAIEDWEDIQIQKHMDQLRFWIMKKTIRQVSENATKGDSEKE